MKNSFLIAAILAVAACGDNASAPASNSGAPASATDMAADTTSAGRRAFGECAICHSAREGDPHRVGPTLFNIVGQPAGKAEGFAYSQALGAAEFVWDREALDGFIENPSTFLPGNRMAYFGNDDPAERAALIDYLESLKP